MTTRGAGASLRGPDSPQQPTFLELFFDLAFVFTFSQLSRDLIAHLNWSGAVGTLLLLLAMMRIWTGTTWVTDRIDPMAQAVQLLVSLTLPGVLVLAVVLPWAFGRYGMVFAVVYVAVHIGRFLFLVIVLPGHQLQHLPWRALTWSCLSAPAWIVGGFTHGLTREVLWAVALAVEFAGIALNFPVPGIGVSHWEPRATAEHLTDRYRQFFIIALGELILVSGQTLSRRGVTAYRLTAFVVSIATTGLLLRIYIYRAGQLLSAAFGRVPMSVRSTQKVASTHITMVAGIVVTAVGAELVITHPSGSTAPAWGVVLLGGPALFVAGRIGFEYTVFARVTRDRPAGVLVLAALTPAARLVPPLLVAVAAMAILAGIAIGDTTRVLGRPTKMPSPKAEHPDESA
jgi:low temperature requirement protein LtrA